MSTPETRSQRVNIRLAPSTKAIWEHEVQQRGHKTLTDLIEVAVAAYTNRKRGGRL